jgi:SAM-dependent methyltransferase
VALLCPYIFNRYYELSIALVLGYLTAGAVIVAAVHEWLIKSDWRFMGNSLTSAILAGGLALVIWAQIGESYKDYDVQVRNFYGVASVKTEYSAKGNPVGRVLYNGKINHGYQFLKGERRYRPNSYYAAGSGVDVAFNVLRERDLPLDVAVIGLGTGTLAAHGRKGDKFQFYEIDQKIADLARTQFTYLADTPAQVDVRMGDARLFLQDQLDKEGSQKFDLIVLDAFSGDAIPVHLLTLEAFILYRQHLRPNGILAVHTSNRHLKLPPVVARLANEIEASAVLIEREEDDNNYSYNAASDWVLVSADPSVIHDPMVAGLGRLLDEEAKTGPRWTDAFSNLWEVLD